MTGRSVYPSGLGKVLSGAALPLPYQGLAVTFSQRAWLRHGRVGVSCALSSVPWARVARILVSQPTELRLCSAHASPCEEGWRSLVVGGPVQAHLTALGGRGAPLE